MWLLPLYLLIDSNALNNLYIDGCVEGRMLFSSSLTYLLVHHDIRPFEELDNIQELDREFSRYTPWIMRMTEDSIKTSSNEDETV